MEAYLLAKRGKWHAINTPQDTSHEQRGLEEFVLAALAEYRRLSFVVCYEGEVVAHIMVLSNVSTLRLVRGFATHVGTAVEGLVTGNIYHAFRHGVFGDREIVRFVELLLFW